MVDAEALAPNNHNSPPQKKRCQESMSPIILEVPLGGSFSHVLQPVFFGCGNVPSFSQNLDFFFWVIFYGFYHSQSLSKHHVGECFWVTFFHPHPFQSQIPNPRKQLQVPWTILPALQSFSRHRGRWGRDASFWSGDVGSQEELLSLTIPLETCCEKNLKLHHLM